MTKPRLHPAQTLVASILIRAAVVGRSEVPSRPGGFVDDATVVQYIHGSSIASNHFRVDMPRYVEFYLQGRLHLDELISQRIRLEQINEAFELLETG